jgi:hypothetical protein
MFQNTTHRAIIDGIFYRSSWISDPPTKLNVKAIVEGYYNPSLDLMNTKDFIKVYVRRAVSPFDIVDEGNSVLDSSTFEVKYNLQNTTTGTYYIVLDHKNGLETWSKAGGEYIIRGSTYDYDFTSSVSQAFGNNLTQVGIKYCVYSGDVLHDGLIDLYDVIDISNIATSFIQGNTIWDINGDKNVDLTDVIIASNNSFKFIGIINP